VKTIYSRTVAVLAAILVTMAALGGCAMTTASTSGDDSTFPRSAGD
jgi:hypothetical protein